MKWQQRWIDRRGVTDGEKGKWTEIPQQVLYKCKATPIKTNKKQTNCLHSFYPWSQGPLCVIALSTNIQTSQGALCWELVKKRFWEESIVSPAEVDVDNGGCEKMEWVNHLQPSSNIQFNVMFGWMCLFLFIFTTVYILYI